MSRKTLGMISGKVKTVDISSLDENRYDFLSLENAEPNPGAPVSDNGILSSSSTGAREWLIPDQGLSVSASNELFVDETTVSIDTSGYNFSTSTVLSDVLADLDQNISDAVSGNIDAVETDSTISGDGTTNNPLSAVLSADSERLGGELPGYYLNYNNFSNTPTIGDGTLTVTGGIGLTGSGSFDANATTNNTITIDHSDTSAQNSVNNSDGSIIQDVSLDNFGHVTSLGSVDLDSRYYTQSSADSTFVNVSGDTMTGFLTLNDDPTNNLHAATKRYVDEVAQGLSVKPSDYVATTQDLPATYSTGNNTLTADSNGAISIDGTTLSIGETVLVKDQSDAYENGSYEVTQTGDSNNPWVLTRTEFMNETLEIAGAFEFIENGETNAATGWVATVPSDFELNNTSASTDSDFVTRGDIVWVQFSGAGSFTAGSGLDLNGNEFSHSDTSSQSSVGALTGSSVVSEVGLDGFGHVTTLSTRSLSLGDLGYTGDVDATNYAGWDLLTDGTFRSTITSDESVNIVGGASVEIAYSSTNNTVTIDHADTSSQDTVNNSGSTVIQDIVLDNRGHVTGVGSKTIGAADIESTIPFYRSDGTKDNIGLTTTSELPFFKSDGTQDNISLI